MDINVNSSPSSEKIGAFARACQYLMSLTKRLKDRVVDFALMAKKIGQDDPRRVVHAFKVGLAITIVSLFYYFQPLYNGFGVSAMWAVLTVVVVFEYSVGATLGKGFNRMMATCVAGFLGVLAHHVANLSGKIGEPILLGFFGFLVAGIMTFMRFFPKLKARHDYAMMIFILTFSLVSVSGYRDDEVLKMAQQRLSTILIGSWISMIVCIFICPVWNGAEFHKLVASNIEKLGNFLEGFGEEYYKTKEGKPKEEKFSRNVYKSVLGSKSTEETHANLAAWEPSHGRFRFRHPWKQYLKIGALARNCAYRVDALNSHLDSNVQTPPEIQEKTKEACTKLSFELGKALKDIASELKKMRKTLSKKKHVNKCKEAAQELKTLLEDTTFWEKFNLWDVLPAATVASILIDIVNCVESISEGVNELATMAHFKSMESTVGPDDLEVSQMIDQPDHDHHVVTIRDVIQIDVPDKESSSATKSLP